MNASRPLPRHVQISERLIREIASGLLPDGTRLPPERDMARDLDVAVGTLRKALSTLEEAGVLVRKQGSGNYVRRKSRVSSLYSQFRLELSEGGGLPTAQLLSVIEQTALPDGVTFDLPGPVLRIERERFLDNQPIAYERIWIERPDISLADAKISDSLYAWYQDALGMIITRVEDRVSVSALPASVTLNTVSEGECVGFIERFAWDQTARPAEYSQTWFDPEKARFFSRTESPVT